MNGLLCVCWTAARPGGCDEPGGGGGGPQCVWLCNLSLQAGLETQ